MRRADAFWLAHYQTSFYIINFSLLFITLNDTKEQKVLFTWTLWMLGNFSCFLLSSADFFQNYFFREILLGTPSVSKWIGSRSSGLDPNCLIKFISRRQNSLLADEELIISKKNFKMPLIGCLEDESIFRSLPQVTLYLRMSCRLLINFEN